MRRAVETALRVASNYMRVQGESEEGENQPEIKVKFVFLPCLRE